MDIDSAIRKVYSLRKKKKEIELEEKSIKAEIIQQMETNQKRIYKTGNYSCELYAHNMVMYEKKIIMELMEKGILPENVCTKKVVKTLKIAYKGDIKLKGNKFIMT